MRGQRDCPRSPEPGGAASLLAGLISRSPVRRFRQRVRVTTFALYDEDGVECPETASASHFRSALGGVEVMGRYSNPDIVARLHRSETSTIASCLSPGSSTGAARPSRIPTISAWACARPRSDVTTTPIATSPTPPTVAPTTQAPKPTAPPAPVETAGQANARRSAGAVPEHGQRLLANRSDPAALVFGR